MLSPSRIRGPGCMNRCARRFCPTPVLTRVAWSLLKPLMALSFSTEAQTMHANAGHARSLERTTEMYTPVLSGPRVSRSSDRFAQTARRFFPTPAQRGLITKMNGPVRARGEAGILGRFPPPEDSRALGPFLSLTPKKSHPSREGLLTFFNGKQETGQAVQ